MTEPRLYIVMREDLWDMNPGKAMAQAAHAQADFDDYCHPDNTSDNNFWEAVVKWTEDRAFGTTLVLHEPLNIMNQIRERMSHSGMTVDPTYPYRNHYGELFVRKEVTCMWVFATHEKDLEYMKQWKLHQ